MSALDRVIEKNCRTFIKLVTDMSELSPLWVVPPLSQLSRFLDKPSEASQLATLLHGVSISVFLQVPALISFDHKPCKHFPLWVTFVHEILPQE